MIWALRGTCQRGRPRETWRQNVEKERGSGDSRAGWKLLHVLRNAKLVVSKNARPYFPCREKDMMMMMTNVMIHKFIHCSYYIPLWQWKSISGTDQINSVVKCTGSHPEDYQTSNVKVMPPLQNDWSLLVSTFFKNQRFVVKFFRQCFHLFYSLAGIL